MGKMSKKKKIWTIVLSVIAILILLAVIVGIVVFNHIFGGLKRNEITKDTSKLGIVQEVEKKEEETKITNIALFGVDTRSDDSFEGRSDSIMVLSIDKKTKTLKLTSILRDSQVLIDGYGNDKITHAYAYGGPELAIKTLNQNFKLDIKDYVTINFAGLEDIINILGGVEIEVTEAEKNHMNSYFHVSPQLEKSGKIKLTGSQALAYSRIRYIDSDSVRANRQRNVLEAMFTKVKSMNALEYPSLLKSIMPLVETSLSYTGMMSYAPMMASEIKLEQTYIPNQDDNPVGGGDPWHWEFDVNASADRLHRFIYGQ